MAYEIEFTSLSLEDLKVLRAVVRSKVIDAIKTHLRVVENVVEIIAIIPKAEATEWLLREGQTRD